MNIARTATMWEERRNDCEQASISSGSELTAILYARDREEARMICGILDTVRIPTSLGDGRDTREHGILVLVPDVFRERASDVPASVEATEPDWDDEDDDDSSDHGDDDLVPFPDDEEDEFEDDDDDGDDDELPGDDV